MIGRLRGILVEKQPPHLIIDVGGIGYEVEVPMTTLYGLPTLGSELILYIHQVVREDALLLYGFAQHREQALFRELIRLSGVGPKLALALMSALEADEFIQVVQTQDTARLIKVPGVGKRTAERLLVELKDRFKAWHGLSTIAPLVAETDIQAPRAPATNVVSEAISALVALGFKPQEASQAVAAVGDTNLSSEELIRQALRGTV